MQRQTNLKQKDSLRKAFVQRETNLYSNEYQLKRFCFPIHLTTLVPQLSPNQADKHPLACFILLINQNRPNKTCTWTKWKMGGKPHESHPEKGTKTSSWSIRNHKQ